MEGYSPEEMVAIMAAALYSIARTLDYLFYVCAAATAGHFGNLVYKNLRDYYRYRS